MTLHDDETTLTGKTVQVIEPEGELPIQIQVDQGALRRNLGRDLLDYEPTISVMVAGHVRLKAYAVDLGSARLVSYARVHRQVGRVVLETREAVRAWV